MVLYKSFGTSKPYNRLCIYHFNGTFYHFVVNAMLQVDKYSRLFVARVNVAMVSPSSGSSQIHFDVVVT